MSERTEGPWEVEDRGNMRVIGSDCLVVPTGRRGHICEVRDQIRQGRVEANARLISAAPELLEACQAAHHELTRYGPDGGYGQDKGNPLPTQLREAIAKAEGSE